ncbi:hypothetical protein V5O48_004704 [Marasmius crinis-equi]|uniref:Trichothecene 3-O-acetyltransferase-like N-terminal domain-containing protein n=1 Tax=Marasmius crinis-equi TaxID=585013 RepID=A0ABR3FPF0_9AGAR
MPPDSQTWDLDILGQQPLLGIYTQICLCFPIEDSEASHSAIIDVLKNALARLTASFPWVAGQVVRRDAGVFRIEPYEETPRLVIRDLRKDATIPSMDALRRANFPFRMLDESIIAPRNTIPTPDEASLPSPVLVLQANLITEGLVLAIVAQHQTMDMTGQGQIIHLLSKACRDEGFTSEELSVGNLDRHELVPLLDESYRPGPEISRSIVQPPPSYPEAPPPPPHSTWLYFSFPHASLAALKSKATETLPSGFISTDDTLSAFVWQSIARARLHRLKPTDEVTFGRAVDVRQALGIPKTYPGLMQNMVYHTTTLHELLEMPLGVLASQFRSILDPKALAHNTRALTTFLDRSLDKSTVSFAATLDLAKDFMLSSWAKIDSCELDFGFGLGKPESVRRPQFIPVESLGYLMPKTLDGEIALAVCVRDEDMEGLKTDKEFKKYGQCIQ